MRLLSLLLLPIAVGAQTLTAEAIMRRVAENQDRAIEQRKSFVFQQRARVRLTKGSNKLKREETRHYQVAPTPDGLEKELVEVEVTHRKDGESLHFAGLGELGADEIDGIDTELTDTLFDELADTRRTRDGINPKLFPLTSDQQQRYRFELVGAESYRERQVWRILYEPKGSGPEFPWRGEVLVDQTAMQPVLVTSEMAWKVPLWVRTVFGVNIQQLGFKVSYDEAGDGVWFPATYGGEFRIKALHLFRRRAAVSLINYGFQRTSVESSIDFQP